MPCIDRPQIIEAQWEVLFEASVSTQAVLRTMHRPLLVLDESLRVVSANGAYHRTFVAEPAATEGLSVFELGNGQWDLPELRHLLQSLLSDSSVVENYRVEHDFERTVSRVIILNAHRIESDSHDDYLRRKENEARIARLALYDALTGLPNRTLLEDRFISAVAQTRRAERMLGVFLLDIDRFKDVNDT